MDGADGEGSLVFGQGFHVDRGERSAVALLFPPERTIFVFPNSLRNSFSRSGATVRGDLAERPGCH
jgi:hypothetical protein